MTFFGHRAPIQKLWTVQASILHANNGVVAAWPIAPAITAAIPDKMAVNRAPDTNSSANALGLDVVAVEAVAVVATADG